MKKYAVITGGTKGIGLALVDKFIIEGFHVITCARKRDDLDLLNGKYSDSIDVFEANLEIKEEVLAFSSFIKNISKEIHVIVNNAGVFLPGKIMEEPDENFEKQMALNLNAVYYLSKSLSSNLINKESYIANICSTASFMAYENGGSYSISKFAVLGLTKVLREEMKSREIAVSAIMPGATYTNSWEGTELPIERFMKATDVVNAIWLGYDSRKTAVLEEIVLRPVMGDL
jgi:short-subunit dehydrogenase